MSRVLFDNMEAEGDKGDVKSNFIATHSRRERFTKSLSSDMNETRYIKIGISMVATILVIAHLIWPDLAIDFIAIVLVIVAVLPWLASVIESAVFPGGWEVVFREVKDTVDKQQEQIEDQERIINDLVIFSMASWLFFHLKKIYYAQKTGAEYVFHKNDDFTKDLCFLRDNGYIEILGIRQLEDGADLAKEVKITPIGSYYVDLREKREKEVQAAAAGENVAT